MLETHTTNRLLSTSELARLLGVPVPTVYGWQTRGKGSPAYRLGRHTRYREDEVLAWLELKRKPTKESIA
jgi:excisionase family DNA binding protein